jgi:cytochrome c oxidase assembly factor CtaG
MTPDPYSFSWEPLFVPLGIAAGALYVKAARADPPGKLRATAFFLGVALVVVPVNSPLETLAAHYLLIVHLLQNVMIADWAPPLLILGLTPAMRLGVAARGGRPFELLTRPRVALPLWLVGWYAIHLGALYDLALENPALLNVEHLVLLALGLVFWWPVFEPEGAACGARPEEHGLSPRSGSSAKRLATPYALAYLFTAFAAASFLGLALIFSSTPFYDFYESAPRLWGLSPAKDQNLGGILMNAEQTLVFFAALAWFLFRLFEEEEEAQRLREHPGPPSPGRRR